MDRGRWFYVHYINIPNEVAETAASYTLTQARRDNAFEGWVSPMNETEMACMVGFLFYEHLKRLLIIMLRS